MSSTTTGGWPQNSHTHSSIICYIISTATVQYVLLIERIFSTVAIFIDFLISACKQLYVQIKIVNHRRFRPDYNGDFGGIHGCNYLSALRTGASYVGAALCFRMEVNRALCIVDACHFQDVLHQNLPIFHWGSLTHTINIVSVYEFLP